MDIHKNISLKKYNSFGIDVLAKYFSSVNSFAELSELMNDPFLSKMKPFLLLGGGSNVLFTKNYDGFVIKNNIKGIELIKEDDQFFYVKAHAGENWHEFVRYCIINNYAGVENLSLIPGNVGASPIQNIGAYGVELKDVFYALEAYHISEKRMQTFSLLDCGFGYRESVFKRNQAGEFIIVNVTFKFSKKPVFHISYGAIEQQLDKMKVHELSIEAISEAVVQIRSSKLPNPTKLGNAGSFFKNPIIPTSQFEQLKSMYPSISAYAAGTENYKVAAGWLIEQCGWKGYRKDDAGCYSKQALVLVNYGKASGHDIFQLSEEIIVSVFNRFQILLEREVNIL